MDYNPGFLTVGTILVILNASTSLTNIQQNYAL